VPQPLHGVAPRVVLGRKWWDEQRKAAYRRTDYCCAACGTPKCLAKPNPWLDAHEFFEIDYAKGRMKLIEIVALCGYCHEFIHCGRLRALMDQGKVSQQHYAAVIKHGNRVLASAGLSKPPVYNGKMAPWGRWRLRIGRKLYPPLYKSRAEWEAAMGNRDDE